VNSASPINNTVCLLFILPLLYHHYIGVSVLRQSVAKHMEVHRGALPPRFRMVPPGEPAARLLGLCCWELRVNLVYLIIITIYTRLM